MSYAVVAHGLLLPFWGTTLGAALVLLMKKQLAESVRKSLTGLAAGVMLAASVWSLLIPAIEQCGHYGKLAALPAIFGFCFGAAFLLTLDRLAPRLTKAFALRRCPLAGTGTTVLAIVLHNIPEGMAVGVVFAAWLTGQPGVTKAAAFSLVFGIAVQNFPEGAIVSMPVHGSGVSRVKSFLYGVASGVVEPLAGAATLLTARFAAAVLPYLLGFSAGAMIYAVAEELIPDMTEGGHTGAVLLFLGGFSLMMFLDVALS